MGGPRAWESKETWATFEQLRSSPRSPGAASRSVDLALGRRLPSSIPAVAFRFLLRRSPEVWRLRLPLCTPPSCPHVSGTAGTSRGFLWQEAATFSPRLSPVFGRCVLPLYRRLFAHQRRNFAPLSGAPPEEAAPGVVASRSLDAGDLRMSDGRPPWAWAQPEAAASSAEAPLGRRVGFGWKTKSGVGTRRVGSAAPDHAME